MIIGMLWACTKNIKEIDFAKDYYIKKYNRQPDTIEINPLFAEALLNNKPPTINGDGSHSRDFTYVANAVQANILSLFTSNSDAVNQVYNIACGEQTSLLDLFDGLKKEASSIMQPLFGPERKGDVKHSLADISKAKHFLGYNPGINVEEGLRKTFNWYKSQKV